jgi:hypothetical protein
MQQDIREMTIQNYKTQIAHRKIRCSALANELRNKPLTFEQRDTVAHCLEKELREAHAFQFMLDRLEQEEHEDTADGESSDSATQP